MCASWFAVTGDDQDILAVLFKHADVLPDEVKIPPPPDGYANWLDFAVENIDARSLYLDMCVQRHPEISREEMLAAVEQDLRELRAAAGVRDTYKKNFLPKG